MDKRGLSFYFSNTISLIHNFTTKNFINHFIKRLSSILNEKLYQHIKISLFRYTFDTLSSPFDRTTGSSAPGKILPKQNLYVGSGYRQGVPLLKTVLGQSLEYRILPSKCNWFESFQVYILDLTVEQIVHRFQRSFVWRCTNTLSC